MSEYKFDKTLIAWVNCLNLTTPICDIADLKDGLFYSKLMKDIKRDCREEIADNVCVAVINFLKPYYLDQNAYDNVKSFCELTNNDIIIITALLLHHTCIVCTKESFKNSMCEKLSGMNQIWIKEFLEKFDDIKNYNDIVTFDIKPTSLNQKTQNKSDSPLSDYFQTPIRRIRIVEKDKRIKHLMSELELERSEKAELQDELRSEQNKVKVITLQLKEKTDEAKKIRTDLYALQARTPPQNNIADLNEIRRRYNSQIESLEMFIKQLQDELDKLQTSNIDVTEKLKKKEIEATKWEEKYVTVETQLDTLQDEYKSQSAELQFLQVQCDELNAMLQENKISKSLDESSINCVNNDESCDRLGCALTMAELEEMTKQRDETKLLLKESLDKELILNTEVSNYKVRLENMDKEYAELRKDNDLLTSKLVQMDRLENNFKQLDLECKKITMDLTQSETINTELNAELTSLHTTFKEVESKLRQKEEYCKSIENELAQFKNHSEMLNNKFKRKCNQFDDLTKESLLLQSKYATLIDNFNKSTFELNALTKTFNELDTNMGISLQKLQNLIYDETQNEAYDNKIEFINKLIDCLAANKESTLNERKNFVDKINNLELVGKELENQITNLKEARNLDVQEKNGLNSNIKNLERHIEELRGDIDCHSNKIHDLENIIKNMEGNINDLEKLKMDLIKENDELNEALAEGENKLKDATFLQNNQKMQIDDMQNKINILQLDIISQRDHITQLEEDLTIVNSDIEKKNSELQHFSKLNEELKLDYETTTTKLTNKVTVLTATIDEIQKEFASKVNKNREMHNLLEDQLQKYKELECDKESIMQEYNDLNKKLNLELERLVAKELEISDKNKAILLHEDNINTLKSSIEAKDVALKDLQQLLGNQETTIDLLQNNIRQLTESKEHLHGTIAELQQENNVLKDLKENLEDKNCSLESNIEKLFQELSAKKEELQSSICNLNTHKENTIIELANQQKNLRDAQEQLDKLTNDYKMTVSGHEIQIKEFNDKINALTKDKDILTAKEIECIQELQRAKQEINEYLTKYTIALQTQHEIKQEHDAHIQELTENLHDLLTKYNNLKEQSAMELQDAQSNVYTLQRSNEVLESQLSEEKLMYENHFKEMENQLNVEIRDLKEKQVNLEKETELLREELETTNSNKDTLEKEINEIAMKLKEITTEKAELQRRHTNLNDNYSKMIVDVESMKKGHLHNVSQLEETLERIHKERNILIEEKKNNEEEQINLKTQIDELVQEVAEVKTKKECLMKEKNEEIKDHLKQLEILEARISSLTEENSYLTSSRDKAQEKINELTTQSQAAEAKMQEYDENCTKFKTAYDLLESCKKKLEIDCEHLMKTCHVLRDEKESIKRKCDGEIQEKLMEISKLNDHLNYYQESNDVKDQNIIMLQTNIKDLTEKLEGKEEKVDQLVQEKDNLEQKIMQLKEQFELKLSTKDMKIEELKALHDVTTTDLINLRTDNLQLQSQISEYIKESEKLKEVLSEKELITSLLSEQKEAQEESMRNITQELANVTEKFNLKLQELNDMKNEKSKIQIELNKCLSDVEKVKKSRDELMDSQTKMIKETENNILRAHNNAIEVKNDLLKRVDMADTATLIEKGLRQEIEGLLKEEKENKDVLNNRIIELEYDKNRMVNIFNILSRNLNKLSGLIQEKPLTVEGEAVEYDIDTINDVILDMEYRVTEIFKKKRELSDLIQHLEENKKELNLALKALKEEKILLNDEKNVLLNNYDSLQNEKLSLQQLYEKDNKSLQLLDIELKSLQEKYEAVALDAKNNEGLTEEKIKLQESMEKMKEEYQNLIQCSKLQKDKLKYAWKSRNELEDLVNKLKPKWIDIDMKTYQLTESSHKQLFEKKESLAFIFENVIKDYLKITKNIYNANILLAQVTETCVDQILSNNFTNANPYHQINVDEIEEKVENCKDTIVHFHSQIEEFRASVDKYNFKKEKTQKENVNPNTQNVEAHVKEEEWRKKNLALRQRLTLTDNAKSIFEKKLKQLREENKRLTERTVLIDNDNLYGNLLKEYKQYKQENDKKIEENDKKYAELLKDFEAFKKRNVLKTEKLQPKVNKDVNSEDLQNLRDAYSNVMSENSKLDLENGALLKKLEDCNKQIKNLTQIKTAYEKLLEERDKIKMNLDLIKFNSSKEIDALKKQLFDERDALIKSYSKQKSQLNVDWEQKLEKMKDKMTRMFKEEIESEIMKRISESDRNEYLLTTVEELKEDLKDAKLKIQKAEMERNKTLEQLQSIQNQTFKRDLHGSRDSITSTMSFRIKQEPMDDRNEVPTKDLQKSLSANLDFKHPIDRKYSTMSRNGSLAVINENKASVATSVTDLARDTLAQNKMEDEGEMFNNKYLNDLQSGICTLPKMGRESTSSRLSELAWRNSLVPPHLKSSYPAETQFSNPQRFKDDDLKTGNIDLNDSMSTKLLPNEKSRKKDFGTTSYKRPGPPTPSKNGGRPSLQENEIVHLHNESRTPKRTTPNRLKSLFKKRNSGVGDATENLSATPKPRRLSFFRKH